MATVGFASPVNTFQSNHRRDRFKVTFVSPPPLVTVPSPHAKAVPIGAKRVTFNHELVAPHGLFQVGSPPTLERKSSLKKIPQHFSTFNLTLEQLQTPPVRTASSSRGARCSSTCSKCNVVFQRQVARARVVAKEAKITSPLRSPSLLEAKTKELLQVLALSDFPERFQGSGSSPRRSISLNR